MTIEREITKACQGQTRMEGIEREEKREGRERRDYVLLVFSYGSRTVTSSLTKIIQIAAWSGLAYFDWCSVRVQWGLESGSRAGALLKSNQGLLKAESQESVSFYVCRCGELYPYLDMKTLDWFVCFRYNTIHTSI